MPVCPASAATRPPTPVAGSPPWGLPAQPRLAKAYQGTARFALFADIMGDREGRLRGQIIDKPKEQMWMLKCDSVRSPETD